MLERARTYLSVVLAIFKRDLGRILKNPVALVLMVGACVLPSAYAWLCTAANWDPYQSTAGIRVAVANEDAGAEVEGKGAIDIGDTVVKKLKDNHQLGWAFYDDAQAAVDSVRSGESYAAIVIPRDFSRDFASILTGHFKRPSIDYYLNEKLSASAPDFTNQGADAVQQEIDAAFVDTVSDTVLGLAQSAGHDVQGASETAENSLTAGVRKADDALKAMDGALGDLGPAIDDAKSAADQAAAALTRLNDSVPDVQTTLETARGALKDSRAAASAYGTGVQNSLAKGSQELGAASADASTALAGTAAALTKAYGQSSSALAQARGVSEQTKSLITALQAAAAGNADAQAALARLQQADQALTGTLESLQQANDALDHTLSGVDGALDTLNGQASQGAKALGGAAEKLRSDISPALGTSLDDYADAMGTLSGLAGSLGPSVEQSLGSVNALKDALIQASGAIGGAKTSLKRVQEGLDGTITDLDALESSMVAKGLDGFLGLDAKDVASFVSAPVKLETKDIYPVKNYGSGVVSFFTAVALWVAGFVFIDLLKMRVDPEGLPPFTEGQAYFGRWLLFMFLGIWPPLVVCCGDLLLGIQCESPVAFVFAGFVSCLVYVNVIYALAHAFRYIGKGLAVFFLIVQIPGSSGLYPIQMMPGFYQAIHPWLPFTYTIDAFRQAVGGFYGCDYALDLLALALIYLPAGLFVGLVLGRWASNLNLLLDRRIAATELFDGERVTKGLRFRSSTLLNALLRTPEYRASITGRQKRFAALYPRLKLAGWLLLGGQFVATFLVMVLLKADVNLRLTLLAVMVAGIVVVDTYLLAIVYRKQDLEARVGLLSLPGDAVAREAHRRYGFADPAAPNPDEGGCEPRHDGEAEALAALARVDGPAQEDMPAADDPAGASDPAAADADKPGAPSPEPAPPDGPDPDATRPMPDATRPLPRANADEDPEEDRR